MRRQKTIHRIYFIGSIASICWFLYEIIFEWNNIFPFEPLITCIATIPYLIQEGRPRTKQTYKRQRLKGKISFDYSNHNGIYSMGSGELKFDIHFTKANDTKIYFYIDSTNLKGIAIATEKYSIEDIDDASIFDFSSRVRTLEEDGECGILQNKYGNYCAVKVHDIKDKGRGIDEKDEILFSFIINPQGKTDFRK